MAAPKGNQFWKARSKHGRDKIFSTPEVLWDACQEYFKWIDDNPLQAAELVKFQGKAKIKHLPKMRAMTISGLCIFLDCEQKTWANYRERKDFLQIITRVEEIIRTQKFTGAAAEMLNPNIIARDLGLADKREHSGELKLSEQTDEELDNKIKSLLSEIDADSASDT